MNGLGTFCLDSISWVSFTAEMETNTFWYNSDAFSVFMIKTPLEDDLDGAQRLSLWLEWHFSIT